MMTEAEWKSCTDPEAMLEFLSESGRLSERKQRLFDCACVRRISHLLLDEKGRKALEVAENYADGRASLDDLREAQALALAAADAQTNNNLPGTPNSRRVLAAAAGAAWEYRSGADPLRYAAEAIAWQGLAKHGPYQRRLAKQKLEDERKIQAALLREVVGNPFQPQTIPYLQWARDLANEIYLSASFQRLPRLANALKEAGCNNAKILGHCWLPGPHVRGCWVVDLVLGQK